MTSPHPRSDEWVEVGRYLGITADMEADMCVTTLTGNDIPAVRIPPTNVASLASMGLTLTQPVSVLVPANRAKEAEELLKE